MISYVPLHVHTSRGSLLDAMTTPTTLAKKAKELHLPAIAVTDHGSCANHIAHIQACQREGLTPIFGAELYICQEMHEKIPYDRPYHLLVLAKNEEGYKNLLHMVSHAHLYGFYRKPRLDLATIRLHEWGKGIIATSACLGGEIPQAILRDDPHLLDIIDRYEETFEEFYLEVQPINHGHNPAQEKVNRTLDSLYLPLVATSDIHFLDEEDFPLHRQFISIGKDRDNEAYRECYMKTPQEMYDGLSGITRREEALENTLRIASACTYLPPLDEGQLPTIDLEGKTPVAVLKAALWKACQEKGIPQHPRREQYYARLREELDVLVSKDFIQYFLILASILKDARDEGITITPTARGSAASSLVCYLLDITRVDPLEHGLLFERFLTKEKQGFPDVDVDVATKDRERLLSLIRERFGEESVAQIATYGTLGAKGAIKDAGRILNLPPTITDGYTKMIPDGTRLDELSPHEQAAIDPQVLALASRFEGLERNLSIHAGGVVISPRYTTISDFCSLRRGKDGSVITELDMTDVEKAGLVKMDFLGLSTLDMLEDIYAYAGEQARKEVEESQRRDPATYRFLAQGLTEGIFQLSGEGITKALKELKPQTFEELTDLVSLYRPATIQSLAQYIQHDTSHLETLSPATRDILSSTRGILIYQEQMMQLLRQLGGFREGEADKARKLSSKKKEEAFLAILEDFKTRALARGVDKDEVHTVVSMIRDSARYSFAKAHGVSYTMHTYACAYLKTHYPDAFMAALLNRARMAHGFDTTALHKALLECALLGIRVSPPDITRAHDSVRILSPRHLMMSLRLIKGIQKEDIDIILSHRPNTFEDLCELKLKKTTMLHLIKSGACDTFGPRKQLLKEYGTWRFCEGMENTKPLKRITAKECEDLFLQQHLPLSQVPQFGVTLKGKQKKENDEKKHHALSILNRLRENAVVTQWLQKEAIGDYGIWEQQLLSLPFTSRLFKETRDSFDLAKQHQTVDVPAILLETKHFTTKKGTPMTLLTLITPGGERKAMLTSHNRHLLGDIASDTRYILRGIKRGDTLYVQEVLSYA